MCDGTSAVGESRHRIPRRIRCSTDLDGVTPRWLWRGVSRVSPPSPTSRLGRTVDEALRHAIEAAGEWAQAVAVPRRRLLEALRDDSCVKAALADGAVLAVVPLIFSSGKGAKANILLDAGTLAAVDEAAAAHGLTSSAFIASAALEKIRRGT